MVKTLKSSSDVIMAGMTVGPKQVRIEPIEQMVTTQLICAFVFTYAKISFSREAAHIALKSQP